MQIIGKDQRYAARGVIPYELLLASGRRVTHGRLHWIFGHLHLLVPQLFWRDHHILGFDPAALEELATAYKASLA